MSRFLALDPGTYHCGMAYFYQNAPVAYSVVHIPQGWEIDERIRAIVEDVDRWVEDHAPDGIDLVACERATGIEGRQPAPEVQVLIRRLRRWATRRKAGFYTYHPSTVLASVRPRGVRLATKDLLRLGVLGLYPGVSLAADQDAYDAIAVGHCHITQEIRKLEES